METVPYGEAASNAERTAPKSPLSDTGHAEPERETFSDITDEGTQSLL